MVDEDKTVEPSQKHYQTTMFRTKALFQRRVASSANFESLEACICGQWNSNSLAVPGAWLCKYLSSARVNGCNGAVWSFEVRAIYCYNAGNHRCTYKPTSHIDSSYSDDEK
ncbi:hypothetical protein AVEN_180311-1 [Araneus ventricosus]|uniref:Uncharacterized protein n=1 Tax=Araneus ventricosus TaxID=182803 RepID=A0A4Y2P6A0_ARAVE|nr:hypothetical protein AVEN_180311-1 [Araneus ventricosus]